MGSRAGALWGGGGAGGLLLTPTPAGYLPEAPPGPLALFCPPRSGASPGAPFGPCSVLTPLLSLLGSWVWSLLPRGLSDVFPSFRAA